jgi:hypothetical protein
MFKPTYTMIENYLNNDEGGKKMKNPDGDQIQSEDLDKECLDATVNTERKSGMSSESKEKL